MIVASHPRARADRANRPLPPPVELLRGIDRLAQRRRDGEIGDATFAVLYFIYWQIATCGDRFAARKHKGDVPPAAAAWLDAIDAARPRALPARLHGYLDHHQFHGVSTTVPAALCHWLRGRWRLVVSEAIPSACDVLRAQARGTRMVTAIAAYPRLMEPVLDKPDAFAFFLHDLAHAYKFFHSPALHAGQRRFFAAVEAALDRGTFAAYCADASFAQKFDYLISDMNTHPEHSRRYLRAILIEFHLRRQGKPPSAELAPAERRNVDEVLRAIDAPALAARHATVL